MTDLQAEIPAGNMAGGSAIVTFTGLGIDPINPLGRDVAIEDIAHATANQCRYTGHTRDFYSVAEHSVRVSRLLEEEGFPVESQFVGLLHDASEAYLCDLARPIKKYSALGETYLEIERKLEKVISNKFGLPWPWPEEIKWADEKLLAAEIRDLMPPHPYFDSWQENAVGMETIVPWQPREAEILYLARFEKLCYTMSVSAGTAE